VYVKTSDLASSYSISRSTVYRILKEMQESSRYPPNAIIGVGKRKRISVEAFQDYYTNMEWLRHPNMKKFVKPYREG
jgi:hypothetical protein